MDNDRVGRVEAMLGHTFVDKSFLTAALTAADRRIDRHTGQEIATDGNRRLAQLGESLLRLVVNELLYDRDLDRGEIDSHLKVILTKEYLGKRAIYFGLDAYMEASVRQKDLLAAPSTLRYVAVGVLAAVYLDTGRDLASVVPVARRLGMFSSFEDPPSVVEIDLPSAMAS